MRPEIVLCVARDNGDVGRHAARLRYIAALEGAGAEVRVVAPGDAMPDGFAGLCLGGGEDLESWRYGEPDTHVEKPDPERDELELAMVRRAVARDVPVLGICRGFQVLNVAFGGKLVQHVDGHRPIGTEVIRHEVTAAPGSKLAELYGEAPFTVNSRHHQAVTDAVLAPGLRATAYVGDLVEAFEATAHRYVVGVQWHPERVKDGIDHPERIFRSFVGAVAALAPAR